MATLCADLTVQGRVAACKRPIERGNVDGCCSSVTLHLHVLGWGVVRVRSLTPNHSPFAVAASWTKACAIDWGDTGARSMCWGIDYMGGVRGGGGLSVAQALDHTTHFRRGGTALRRGKTSMRRRICGGGGKWPMRASTKGGGQADR